MVANRAYPALLLVGATACLGAAAQKPAASHRQNYFGSNEIRVDQDCHILPDPANLPPGKKARPYTDSNICHLESVNSSEHVEQKAVGNRLLRSLVDVQEHEFVLWNPENEPVIFVVEQLVPKKWTVDSDPQPKQIIGQVAFFPVHVQPGEVIRLHVGIRHTSAMGAKTIAATR
jgi:hypothetical protein